MAITTNKLKRIAEGREAEIFEWEGGRVLRLFRNARDGAVIEREAAAMRAARAVLPLVPEVFETVDVDGRPGIVMERVDGQDLLAIAGKRPWTVWRCGSITGDTHARLHEVVAPDVLEPLRDRITRIVSRPELMPQRLASFALDTLRDLPDGDRLCHGDFHPANILISPRGPVVIDWPNATRGDPLADYARSLLMIRCGSLPPGTALVVRAGARFARGVLLIAYRRAYGRLQPVDAERVRRWEIVRAADRLGDQIPEERAALLALLERAAAL